MEIGQISLTTQLFVLKLVKVTVFDAAGNPYASNLSTHTDKTFHVL